MKLIESPIFWVAFIWILVIGCLCFEKILLNNQIKTVKLERAIEAHPCKE